MNEVIMVPTEEFNRLSNYYQGKITESVPESALLKGTVSRVAHAQLSAIRSTHAVS